MIASLFHAWEHYFASVSKDRTVRSFDWGLDLIGDPSEDINIPAERLGAWVTEQMSDTTAFFDTPPTREYFFEQAPQELRRQSEAGTLRFPSALVTPHPNNNMVEARWFPSPGEPSIGERGPRGRAVIVLPQWNSDPEGHIGLSRLLARFGVSALRVSLPYHDARMPAELTRADYLVSSNIARTI